MLFIIVHQVSELWMRLLRHELVSVMECVRRDNLDPSFKMLSRIGSVQAAAARRLGGVVDDDAV